MPLFTGSRGQALGGASPALKPFPGLFVLEVVFPASLLACCGQTAAFDYVHPGMGSEQSRGHNSDPKLCSALVLGMNFCSLRAGAGVLLCPAVLGGPGGGGGTAQPAPGSGTGTFVKKG